MTDFCECGCGEPVRKYRGKVNRFIRYHSNKGKNNPMYGKHHTKVAKEKARKAKLNEKNPMWKGTEVELIALHDWVRRRKPKPTLCQSCNKNIPHDLANISGEYKREVNDYEWLCRKCHMERDGRMNKLSVFHFQKGHIPWIKGLTKENDDRVRVIGEAVGNAKRGKKLSKVHREKISESHKGENNPMYGKKCMLRRDSNGRFLCM